MSSSSSKEGTVVHLPLLLSEEVHRRPAAVRSSGSAPPSLAIGNILGISIASFTGFKVIYRTTLPPKMFRLFDLPPLFAKSARTLFCAEVLKAHKPKRRKQTCAWPDRVERPWPNVDPISTRLTPINTAPEKSQEMEWNGG